MSNNEETSLHRSVMLALSDVHTRAWRNNNGVGWQGSSFTIRNRRLVQGAARYVRYGLAPGSSDVIGVRTMQVTANMVGKRVAVPLMIETKTEDQRLSTDQKSWLAMAHKLGCIAGVATSVDEARQIITDWKPALWVPE